jgi:predicted RNA-binding protein with PUA domain
LSGRRGTFNEEGAERETKERRKKKKIERGQKEAKKNGGGLKPTGFLSWAVFARCLG